MYPNAQACCRNTETVRLNQPPEYSGVKYHCMCVVLPPLKSSEDVVATGEALQMRAKFWDSIVCPGVTV